MYDALAPAGASWPGCSYCRQDNQVHGHLADDDFKLRPIAPQDDAAMAHVIRAVMTEFGATGPGFAINDPEVDHLSAAYLGPRAAYFVLEHQGRVVGGGGIGPLSGAAADVCELRKMYFLPGIRGRGQGRRMLDACLEAARALRYRRCYLETLTGMDAAMHLYTQAGCTPLCNPLGATGHCGCDRYYAREL